MSFFIWRMPSGPLMSRPPESKHTPLPTRVTRAPCATRRPSARRSPCPRTGRAPPHGSGNRPSAAVAHVANRAPASLTRRRPAHVRPACSPARGQPPSPPWRRRCGSSGRGPALYRLKDTPTPRQAPRRPAPETATPSASDGWPAPATLGGDAPRPTACSRPSSGSSMGVGAPVKPTGPPLPAAPAVGARGRGRSGHRDRRGALRTRPARGHPPRAPAAFVRRLGLADGHGVDGVSCAGRARGQSSPATAGHVAAQLSRSGGMGSAARDARMRLCE